MDSDINLSSFPKASFRRLVYFLDYDARFNAHGVQIQVTPSTLEYDVTAQQVIWTIKVGVQWTGLLMTLVIVALFQSVVLKVQVEST